MTTIDQVLWLLLTASVAATDCSNDGSVAHGNNTQYFGYLLRQSYKSSSESVWWRWINWEPLVSLSWIENVLFTKDNDDVGGSIVIRMRGIISNRPRPQLQESRLMIMIFSTENSFGCRADLFIQSVSDSCPVHRPQVLRKVSAIHRIYQEFKEVCRLIDLLAVRVNFSGWKFWIKSTLSLYHPFVTIAIAEQPRVLDNQ